VITKP